MDATEWDRRYDQAELVWSATPNMWVEEVTGGLPAGRVLDLAAGEGRNALWLAEREWQATAVDFSRVALDRAAALAVDRLGEAAGRFQTEHADLLDYRPRPRAYDLVLVIYLQLVPAERAQVMRAAADAVAPHGTLLVVAHDSDNLERGYGGPPDPTVLYSAGDVTADLAGSGLRVQRGEQVVRVVSTDDGPRSALDLIVVAVRTADAGGGAS